MSRFRITISFLTLSLVLSMVSLNTWAMSKNSLTTMVMTPRDMDYSLNISAVPHLRFEADRDLGTGVYFTITISETAKWTYNDVSDISMYFTKNGSNYVADVPGSNLTNQSGFRYSLDAFSNSMIQINFLDTLMKDNYFQVPLIFGVSGIAEVTVTVSNGETFGISGGSYVIANEGNVNSAEIQFSGISKSDGAKIVGDVFVVASAGLGDAEIELTLPTGFAFDETNRSKLTLEGNGSYSTARLSGVSFNHSKAAMYVRFSGTYRSTAPGRIDIKNIQVNALDNASDGDITMKFSAFGARNESFNFGEYKKPATAEDVTDDVEPIPDTGFTVIATSGSDTVLINGEKHKFEAAPFNDEAGRMMVPLRFVVEAFGFGGNDIFWDGEKKEVTILFSTEALENEIVFTIGSKEYLVNGNPKVMDTSAIIRAGYTFVPVSYIADAMGISVAYDNITKTAVFKGD